MNIGNLCSEVITVSPANEHDLKLFGTSAVGAAGRELGHPGGKLVVQNLMLAQILEQEENTSRRLAIETKSARFDTTLRCAALIYYLPLSSNSET